MFHLKSTIRLLVFTITIFGGLSVFFIGQTTIAKEPRVLSSSQAFKFDYKVKDKSLSGTWEISKGYFIEKNSIALTVGETQIPTVIKSTPKKINSTVLSGIEAYTGKVDIYASTIPTEDQAQTATITATGCSIALATCYPKLQQNISLFQSDAITIAKPNFFSRLKTSITNWWERRQKQNNILSVDDAFQFIIVKESENQWRGQFDIAENHYLYSDKIDIKNASPLGAKVYFKLPPSQKKEDPYFGSTYIFKKSFSFPIIAQEISQDHPLKSLQITFQGCADQGVCYPPLTRNYDVPVTKVLDSSDLLSKLKKMFSNTSGLLWTAFITGLLLSLTPCTLPLLPILTSMITPSSNQKLSKQGGYISFAYVSGTILTYAAIGAFAGSTGQQLQPYFQNPWSIGGLSALLFFMALSMLGVFKIDINDWTRRLLPTIGFKEKYPLGYAFILGLISSIIVGACVSPIIISILSVAITLGNPYFGAVIMICVALGMGIPLIIFGMGFSYLIPKAGSWMQNINWLFATLLFIVVIYLLDIIPIIHTNILWALLFFFITYSLYSSKYLLISPWFKRIFLIPSTILFVSWGGLILFSFYEKHPAQTINPIKIIIYTMYTQEQVDKQKISEQWFTPLINFDTLPSHIKKAQQENKYILIEFYASWCRDCIRLQQQTFTDPEVVDYLIENYITLSVDISDPDHNPSKEIKDYFGIYGPPAIIVLNENGRIDELKSFYGFLAPEDFIDRIQHDE